MKNLIFLLLISCAAFGQTSQATRTSAKSYKYVQATNGTDEYYVGIDGTNGFSITPFASHTNFTFNVLVNFPSVITSATAVGRMLEIANSGRTSLYGNDIGGFTGTLTNEYIGLFTLISGITRSSGVTSASSIPAGWHMITISVSATVVRYCIDGVEVAMTDGGAGRPQNATNGFTVNKMSLMGTTAGGAYVPTTGWREACLLNTIWSEANALMVYRYYTRNGGVTLANSDRSIWKYLSSSSGRAQIIALYKGNESAGDLLDSKTTASDLTKTGF
jgi:hypothetical protein